MPRRAVGLELGVASAEDRALRGRNLSAAGSLTNGRSGRSPAARLAPAGASLKAINPSIQSASTPTLAGDSSFDRTQNSSFECYTTLGQTPLANPGRTFYFPRSVVCQSYAKGTGDVCCKCVLPTCKRSAYCSESPQSCSITSPIFGRMTASHAFLNK